MSTYRTRRSAAVRTSDAITDTSNSSMSRSRRSGGGQTASSATVSRDQQSSPSTHPSLHLTVKVPSSRLKQATGLAPPTRASGASVAVNSRDHFVGEILQGKRARSVKKSYVLESDSEEEEDEDEEMEDEGGEDAEGESVDDEEMDIDEDAEGEDEDAEGEIEMDIPLPPPIIKISRAEKGSKSTIHVKPAGRPDNKTVEAKDSVDASDDEELSELDSDIEEEEDGIQVGGEEDAEGEDEEIEVAEDEDEDDDLDSDDDTPAGGSRASTPDLTKLTKRQRARLEEGGSGHLLALPDG
jgi:Ino eighty subunit 2